MELLGELAMRFPKADNGDGDKMRLRLLAEDLSDTMSPAALAAAISEGRRVWRFLPTLAEIHAAAEPYREEQRFKARQAALRTEIPKKPVAALEGASTFDSGPIIAEMRAKIDAGTAALIGAPETDPREPMAWQALREAGRHVSPALAALMARR